MRSIQIVNIVSLINIPSFPRDPGHTPPSETPPPSNDLNLGLGNGDNIFAAGSGNDRIWGNRGNDWIFAGPGNDTVLGGPVTTRSMATTRIRRLAVSARRGMTIFSMAATATIALSPVTV
nr:hypothetical protein [Rhizobium sp. T1473]